MKQYGDEEWDVRWRLIWWGSKMYEAKSGQNQVRWGVGERGRVIDVQKTKLLRMAWNIFWLWNFWNLMKFWKLDPIEPSEHHSDQLSRSILETARLKWGICQRSPDAWWMLVTTFLPPASEGWGKVMFSVCSHPGGEGVPQSGSQSLPQALVPGPFGGGGLTCYLVPCPFWTPISGPMSLLGVSQSQPGDGLPQSWLEAIPPARTGVPPSQDCCTALTRTGVNPPPPPRPGLGYPQTGYAPGGTPRAIFRRKDFLVKCFFHHQSSLGKCVSSEIYHSIVRPIKPRWENSKRIHSSVFWLRAKFFMVDRYPGFVTTSSSNYRLLQIESVKK